MSCCRRWLLPVALLLAVSAPAAADDLSDRLRMLFSTQFAFTREGLPTVTVRLEEHQSEITLGGDGVRVLPLGEGGPEVRGSGDWRVTVEGGRPARLRYWSVVERIPIAQKADVGAALARWKQRGFDPRAFEVGTVFGVAGEVLDRRALLIAVGPKPAAADAEHQGDELRRHFRVEASVYPELYERPQGTVVAHGAGGVEVRAEGVLWFAPLAPGGRLSARRVEFGVGYPNHGREDRSYWGKLYVAVDRLGQLALVNAVPEDKLLAGLVPAEMPASAPDEALKAQAVAARAELLTKIGTRHLGDPYLLCSAQHCQVYSGAGREHPRATAAIAATRGQVLFSEGIGDLVDTVYSSSCGGFTESNENVWDDMLADPSLRGRPDVAGAAAAGFARFGGAITDANIRDFLTSAPPSFCHKSSRYRWTVRKTAAELDQLVAALGVGHVKDLAVVERGISGRARLVKVQGEQSDKTVRGELRIRQLLGGLSSSMFVVDVERAGGRPTGFVFTGGGFGHGVGLCQSGAMGMAEAGYTYIDILKHYYRGSRIRKLY
jgi:SpoIID/LytB domain protein